MLSPDFEKLVGARSRGSCAECGKTVPAAMTKHGLCQECFNQKRGKVTVEEHHLLGRDDPATMDLPVNVHCCVSRKGEARDPILKKTSDDPLIEAARMAAIINEAAETISECKNKCNCDCHYSKWREQFIAFIAKAGKWVANMLLALAGWLIKKFGENWYDGFSFPRFA